MKIEINPMLLDAAGEILSRPTERELELRRRRDELSGQVDELRREIRSAVGRGLSRRELRRLDDEGRRLRAALDELHDAERKVN